MSEHKNEKMNGAVPDSCRIANHFNFVHHYYSRSIRLRTMLYRGTFVHTTTLGNVQILHNHLIGTTL